MTLNKMGSSVRMAPLLKNVNETERRLLQQPSHVGDEVSEQVSGCIRVVATGKHVRLHLGFRAARAHENTRAAVKAEL